MQNKNAVYLSSRYIIRAGIHKIMKYCWGITFISLGLKAGQSIRGMLAKSETKPLGTV
jgi:hypothetical protein